jgi:hypothetical protein
VEVFDTSAEKAPSPTIGTLQKGRIRPQKPQKTRRLQLVVPSKTPKNAKSPEKSWKEQFMTVVKLSGNTDNH